MVLEVSEDYFTETEEKDVKQRTGTVNCMIVTLILCIIAELIGNFIVPLTSGKSNPAA